MKGLIALDIDGTTTDSAYHVPSEVASYLKSLVDEGFTVAFITGRTFQFASHALDSIQFPFYLAVQNGSILLKIPSKKILARKYVGEEIHASLEKICLDEPTDYVIASGCEDQDRFYYRPKYFSKDLLEYLTERYRSQKEGWIPLDSFSNLPVKQYASIKCFGKEESAFRISGRIEAEVGLHAPAIRDPFNEGYFVVQATHPAVNKGTALEDLKKIMGCKGVVIAAGDDTNDLSMLVKADVSVVMETAPDPVKAHGDLIAPPASQLGIIDGLKEAIKRCSS